MKKHTYNLLLTVLVTGDEIDGFHMSNVDLVSQNIREYNFRYISAVESSWRPEQMFVSRTSFSGIRQGFRLGSASLQTAHAATCNSRTFELLPYIRHLLVYSLFL